MPAFEVPKVEVPNISLPGGVSLPTFGGEAADEEYEEYEEPPPPSAAANTLAQIGDLALNAVTTLGQLAVTNVQLAGVRTVRRAQTRTEAIVSDVKAAPTKAVESTKRALCACARAAAHRVKVESARPAGRHGVGRGGGPRRTRGKAS